MIDIAGPVCYDNGARHGSVTSVIHDMQSRMMRTAAFFGRPPFHVYSYTKLYKHVVFYWSACYNKASLKI